MKLRELLASPERRAELGERGRAKIREVYSWDGVVGQTLAVYEGVLGG